MTALLPPGASRGIILDSCQVLNLFASRRITEILGSMGCPILVSDHCVAVEALWVGTGRRNEPNTEFEAVDLNPLFDSGVASIAKLESSREREDFVRLATVMDDGEAIAGAIAISRDLGVGTDDRKAITVFGSLVPPVPTISTCMLVSNWAATRSVDERELRDTISAIRRRARFVPPNNDPMSGWWNDLVRAA